MNFNQAYLQQANAIISRFNQIIAADSTLDQTHQQHTTAIEAGFKEKTAELQQTRETELQQAAAFYHGLQVNLRSLQESLRAIESSITRPKQDKFKAAAASPQQPAPPDLCAASELALRINDTSAAAACKRLLKQDGYYKLTEMQRDFYQNIAAARSYISQELEKGANDFQAAQDAAAANYHLSYKEASAKREEFLIQAQEQIQKSGEELARELSELLNGPLLTTFNQQLQDGLLTLGAFEECYESFTPAKEYPSELLLGAITLPFNLPASLVEEVKTKLPFTFNGRSLTLPLSVKTDSPLRLFISYTEASRSLCTAGVQSAIHKLVKFMPLHSFNLTFIDPLERGSNLGSLLKLTNSPNHDLCREIYASKASVNRRLKELEHFIDETSKKLAGSGTVYDYNRQHIDKIPYQFLILHDFPRGLEASSLESLEVILNNAEKCGISLIILADQQATPQIPLPQNVSSLLERAFDCISYSGGSFKLTLRSMTYDFLFDGLPPCSDRFIETAATIYNQGLQIDNSFASLYSGSYPLFSRESTASLLIPFALDSRGRTIELELGGQLTAHALLSGTIGSGKSVTLHALIAGIVQNYHPDDVELWLVDYKKVEFSEYSENLPPHVKLIGLDRTREFTFSLLDKLQEEFEGRMELFQRPEVNVKNIQEYKGKFGARSLPRIVVIIDEFHNLTQAIQSEPHYVTLLENILSEYRALGFSCIFSDQAISDGLRGLTEKGRKQLSNRIALKNDLREIKETLAVDVSYYTEELHKKMISLSGGEAIYKFEVDDGRGGSRLIIDKYKVIHVQQQDRQNLIPRVRETLGRDYTPKDVTIVKGQTRSCLSELNYNPLADPGRFSSTAIPLFVGTPSTFEPSFDIQLRRQIGSNVLLIGADNEMRMSILYHSILSFIQQQNSAVYILTTPGADLYQEYPGHFKTLPASQVFAYRDLNTICSFINTLPDQSKYEKILLVYPDPDALFDELSLLQAPAAISTSGVDRLINNVDTLLSRYSEKETPADHSLDCHIYDARQEICDLIFRGPREGIFTFCTLSSVKSFTRARLLKGDLFEHKIALKMSSSDSLELLGKSAFASTLDDITAAYHNGANEITHFRPYKIPEKGGKKQETAKAQPL